MTRCSQNLARKVSRAKDPQGPFADSPGPRPDASGPDSDLAGQKFDLWNAEHRAAQAAAMQCLNSPYVEIKRMAADLDVAERVVRRWAAGDQLIPESRIPEIIRRYHGYRTRQRDVDAEIDTATDELLAQAYGPHAKRSM